MIAGMPQAKATCRVCGLIATSDEFAKLLHTYRFDKKLNLKALVVAMKAHVDEWNKANNGALPMFSIRALSNHFNKHETAEVQMRYQLENQARTTTKSDPNRSISSIALPQAPGVAQAQLQVHQKSVAVFDELFSLFTRTKGLFEEYMKRNPTISALTIHLEIVRELRKTLSEIAKLKQSKELVKMAVKSVVDTMLTKLVEDMGKSLDSLRARLVTKYGADQKEIDVMIDRMRQELAGMIMDAVKAAIDKVRQEFALNDAESDSSRS